MDGGVRMNGLIWVIIGVIIAVCIFLFFPGAFDFLVAVVQWVIHAVSGLLHSSNVTGV